MCNTWLKMQLRCKPKSSTSRWLFQLQGSTLAGRYCGSDAYSCETKYHPILNIISLRLIHVTQFGYIHSVSMLYFSVTWIDHKLYIHLSFDECLTISILEIIPSALMNVFCICLLVNTHKSWWTHITGLLDHKDTCMLNFTVSNCCPKCLQ